MAATRLAYPLSPGVCPRLDEILDGSDDHRETETADEDVEDAGDVA